MFLKGVNLTVNREGKKEGVSEYHDADDSTMEVTASIVFQKGVNLTVNTWGQERGSV